MHTQNLQEIQEKVAIKLGRNFTMTKIAGKIAFIPSRATQQKKILVLIAF